VDDRYVNVNTHAELAAMAMVLSLIIIRHHATARLRGNPDFWVRIRKIALLLADVADEIRALFD
jgi:hypothetical protein